MGQCTPGCYERFLTVACAPSGDCPVVEEDNWPGADYEIRGRFVMPYHLYLPLMLPQLLAVR